MSARSTGRSRPGATPAEGPPAGPEPLVLLVDDVADNRTVYAMWLTALGYRVAEAATGDEALDAVEQLSPDIVVMDLSLPRMDGWEATRRIKAAPASRHIPVVALTGYALADHAHRARDAGCDLVITKPCLPEDLEQILRRLIGRGPAAPPGRP